MFYRFDITKWILMLVPPVLRRSLLVALLQALLTPVRNLNERFYELKTGVDRQLASNAFTIYLERYLNGLFYLSDEIYITDAINNDHIYFSKSSEIADLNYIGYDDAQGTLYLPSLLPMQIRGDFVINIPEFLDKDEYRSVITKWTDYFKYAGTQYIIRTYSNE